MPIIQNVFKINIEELRTENKTDQYNKVQNVGYQTGTEKKKRTE
jgi:hypothetical protein